MLLRIDRHRAHGPDFIAIFADSAIGGKLTAARDVEYGHALPVLRLHPRRAHLLLAGHVGRVIGQYEEWIGIAQIIDERPEHLRVATRKMAARDEVEYGAKFRIGVDVSRRPIPLAPNALHIGRSETEEEKIIRADLLPHLHIGTIGRPNGERT